MRSPGFSTDYSAEEEVSKSMPVVLQAHFHSVLATPESAWGTAHPRNPQMRKAY